MTMEWPLELTELFDDPILAEVRPKPTPLTANDRRVKRLMEITTWAEQNGRPPRKDGTLSEKLLWKSLETLRGECVDELKPYDSLNLLEEQYGHEH